MSYEIKSRNKLKQPIICSLDDGTTFSIYPKDSKVIKDEQVNQYIKDLAKRGFISLKEIESTVKKAEAEAQHKKKGGKDNANIIEA